MLHEGLGCIALWRDFPAAVVRATGFGVLVYSRAGYGQSDLADLPRPINYMTDEALVSLPEVLDHMGIRRCVLMGHSDGATIAAIYAGSVPDYRVRGVILMAPHFFTEPMGLAAIGAANAAYGKSDMRARMAKYHRNPDNTFRGWADSWLNPEFTAWNVADVIDHIRVPVLVVQGVEDQYGTLAQVREVETRCPAPVETAVLDDCRHAPFLEQPDMTLEAVRGFIMRLSRIEDAGIRPT